MVVAVAEAGEIEDLCRNVRQMARDPDGLANAAGLDQGAIGHPRDHADPMRSPERNDHQAPGIVRTGIRKAVVEERIEGNVEGHLEERHGNPSNPFAVPAVANRSFDPA